MTTAGNDVDMMRYAREYERLRSQVSGASPQPPFATPPVRGIGLALLLRDGLPAWIGAVRQVLNQAAASAVRNAGAAPSHPAQVSLVTSPLAAGVDGSGVAISPSPLLEPTLQRDLTTLLASLVLSARRTSDAASMKEPNPCH